jgi:DNA-binding NarL/FixJ family response regulator
MLTKRESEIIGLVANGASNKEIASKLNITDKTVKCHLFRIFKKLNIKSRLQLVRYALRYGLVRNDLIEDPPSVVGGG